MVYFSNDSRAFFNWIHIAPSFKFVARRLRMIRLRCAKMELFFKSSVHAAVHRLNVVYLHLDKFELTGCELFTQFDLSYFNRVPKCKKKHQRASRNCEIRFSE